MPAVKGMHRAGPGFMGLPDEQRTEIEQRRRQRFAEMVATRRAEYLARVEKLADKGATIDAIAATFHCTPANLRRRLRQLGRPDLIAAISQPKMSTAEVIEEIEFLVTDSVSLEQAAERLAMHPETLATRLRRAERQDLLHKLQQARVWMRDVA